MKKLFFNVVMAIMLCVFAGTDNYASALTFPALNNNAQQENVQKSAENTVTPPSAQKTQGEGKIVLGKFFNTMKWVLGSGVVLFLILFIFRRKMGNITLSSSRPMTKEQDLTSPATVDEAVKLFIEKF